MTEKELERQIQLIKNGHNTNVEKATDMLSERLMTMVTDCQGKEGEELAGTMNFHFMEITRLLRRAAAIGYYCAIKDIEDEQANA